MTAQGQSSISERAIEDARANIVDVIGRYVHLEKRGGNYFACCPFHGEKSPSFTVKEEKELFHCFGCGESGDAIDFVMKHEGLKFREAVEAIVGKTAAGPASFVPRPAKVKPEPKLRAIRMVPENAPQPEFWSREAGGLVPFWHWRLGAPAVKWIYNDANGNHVGYVCRFNTTNKDGSAGKETLPLTWAVNTETGEQGWEWLSFAGPRTLYGAELLAQRPDAPVLVLEGEKTADAGRRLFTGFVVVTWPGGGNAVDMADWSMLAGRNVTLWGDWDSKIYKQGEHTGQLMPEREQTGTKAMEKVYAHLRETSTSLRFVKPMAGAPDGWDLADDAPCDGFTPLGWARANTVPAAEYFERPPEGQDMPPEPPPEAYEQPQAANDNRRKPGPRQPGAAFEWPLPLDVFGIQSPPELPIELLPHSMQEYVRDQANLTGCDPGIIGLGALVSAAACIDDGIKLQPKRYDQTWTESGRLWVAFVGDPSTKKSPAIAKAVRHVKRIDHNMAEENAKGVAEFKRQLGDWKESKKADRNLPTPEPKPPAMKRLVVEDITVEALTEVLKDNKRGVLTLKDELTGWFAGMDAYKGGAKGASMDRAHWLEAYNGGRRTIDRVTRGAIVVPNWSTCIIGGIQPDMMRRIASSMGNDGLLQRFIVYCARAAGEDADQLPDMDAMVEFRRTFDHLLSIQANTEAIVLDDGAHACRLRVSGYAKRLIAAIDHPHIQAWLGKWDGLFARLLLVYHVLVCSNMSVHPVNEEVTAATASQVERLMCSILLPHALHFYTEVIDANDRQQHVRQLARVILSKNLKRITTRDMAIQWKASRKLERWELRAVVDVLATMGWLEPEPDALDSDGKPRAWLINPAVHETFAQQATREAERRREAVETLREMRDAYQVAAA